MEHYCNICKKTISKYVYDASMTRYGKPLCITHQNKVSHSFKSSYQAH